MAYSLFHCKRQNRKSPRPLRLISNNLPHSSEAECCGRESAPGHSIFFRTRLFQRAGIICALSVLGYEIQQGFTILARGVDLTTGLHKKANKALKITCPHSPIGCQQGGVVSSSTCLLRQMAFYALIAPLFIKNLGFVRAAHLNSLLCWYVFAQGRISTGRSPVEMDSSHSGSRMRSEEHTSELQSRPHLVCRLLLEKKNKTQLPNSVCVIS